MRGVENGLLGVSNWLIERELEECDPRDAVFGIVIVATGISSSETRSFLKVFPSCSDVPIRLFDPPCTRMLGFFMIRDFLFFRMFISWRIHSSASDVLFCREASRFSIILFKLFIFR